MFAMKLPKKLAVIKVKAHLTTNTTEAKGNALADVAAKQACFYATVQVCSGSTAQKTILPPESIVDLYKDIPLYEAWTWLDKMSRQIYSCQGCSIGAWKIMLQHRLHWVKFLVNVAAL